MRKIVIYVLLSLGVTLMASEAKVHWAKDFKSGIAQATKEHKPVLFIISRDTCKYCVLLENTTLQDRRVINALNSDFIAIRSWTNKRDYIPAALARATPGLPGIWFLHSNAEPIYQPILGYIDSNKMLEALGVVKATLEREQQKSGE